VNWILEDRLNYPRTNSEIIDTGLTIDDSKSTSEGESSKGESSKCESSKGESSKDESSKEDSSNDGD